MAFVNQSKALVEFRASWSQRIKFPGVHRCTWEVFGEDGSVIGRKDAYFFTVRADSPTWHLVRVPVSGAIPERGTASGSASATCDEERLDEGDYVFSEVEVLSDPSGDASPIDVRTTLSWHGSGPLGVMLCDIKLEDAEGRFVGRRENLLFPAPLSGIFFERVTDAPLTVAIGRPDLVMASASPDAVSTWTASFECSPLG